MGCSMSDGHKKSIKKSVIFWKSYAYGKKHSDTKSFDHMKILNKNNCYSRIHLSKLTWWQSRPWWGATITNGIQCEWDLYDDNGRKIKTITSDENCGKNDNPTKRTLDIPFGYIFHGSGSIRSGDLLDGFQLKSNLKMEENNHQFGGNGGTSHELPIPKGHIVIGFHGGVGGHLHNLGIITMPFKNCVDYDLIKSYFEKYCGFMSVPLIQLILEYIFMSD
eukprot:528311_1